jgi:hypothetical protein
MPFLIRARFSTSYSIQKIEHFRYLSAKIVIKQFLDREVDSGPPNTPRCALYLHRAVRSWPGSLSDSFKQRAIDVEPRIEERSFAMIRKDQVARIPANDMETQRIMIASLFAIAA